MKKIKLTRGKFALVDDEDFEKVAQYSWYSMTNGYAARDEWLGNGQKRMVYMHRFILEAPDDRKIVVDHKNGKKHDNRRENIRLVTQKENGWNSKVRKDNKSGVRGVWYDTAKGRFSLRMKIGNTYKFCGYYDTLKLAAKKRKELLAIHRDELARL